jgi:hypothetical protein
VCEQEPNGSGGIGPPLDLPVLLNGQIMPGDVDRFRFRAARGQQLVVQAQARRFVPYLADAVPGWFQATLALYDASGREVAFADDYRFDPDPVLLYAIPADGEYAVEIRDAIYRGREDFVYRISVGEQPFVTRLFPLGGRVGVETIASLDGRNLAQRQVRLDTRPGADRIRQTVLRQDTSLSNAVTYAVDDLPECNEAEPNDDAAAAQRIELPRIVNGHIARPGDVDLFQFQGRSGEEVVAEVCARRLRSPLDSLLRLTDASGKVLAWNDDHEDKAMGLLTHHADSYLSARLPKDGAYRVQVRDSEEHGGEAYAYRVRLSAPRPDFALRVTPSSINVLAGRAAPIHVYALREDGFAGDIDVALKDPPTGFAITGGRIPAGCDSVHMTLSAPRAWLKYPFVLKLEGRATINGQTVIRRAVPSEDMMQAFAYRHLVPSQELMAKVTASPALLPTLSLTTGRDGITIPVGGTAQVRVSTGAIPALQDLHLELREPPPGISVREVAAVSGGLQLVLQADDTAAHVGRADNLIVEAHVEVQRPRQGGAATGQKRRVPLGVLPAIPLEVVQR